MVIYFQPLTQKNRSIFSTSVEDKSGNFVHFGIMADTFDCYTLHSMSIFLFVKDVVRAVVFGMRVAVSCCLSVLVPTVLFAHDSKFSLTTESAMLCSHKALRE